jgi:hypothetical protein
MFNVRLVTFSRGRTIPVSSAVHSLSTLEAIAQLLRRNKRKIARDPRADPKEIMYAQAQRLDPEVMQSFPPPGPIGRAEEDHMRVFYTDADYLHDHFMLSCHLYEMFRCKKPASVGELPIQLQRLMRVPKKIAGNGYIAAWFSENTKHMTHQSKAVLFSFCCSTRMCRKRYVFSAEPEPVPLSAKRKSWDDYDVALKVYDAIAAFHTDLTQTHVRHAVKGYFSQQYSKNDGVYVFSRKPRSAIEALMQWIMNSNYAFDNGIREFLDHKGSNVAGSIIVALFERDMTEAEVIMGWQYLTFSKQLSVLEDDDLNLPAPDEQQQEEKALPFVNQSQARAHLNKVLNLARKKKRDRTYEDAHGIFSDMYDARPLKKL